MSDFDDLQGHDPVAEAEVKEPKPKKAAASKSAKKSVKKPAKKAAPKVEPEVEPTQVSTSGFGSFGSSSFGESH